MLRPHHLAFGLTAYLLALGSMLAFVGFLAGLLPGRPIDAAADAVTHRLGADLATDLVLLLSFALVHSLLARAAVKRRLLRLVPEPLERAAFSLVASLQMMLLLGLWRPLPGALWTLEAPAARAAVWALAGGGWGLVLAGLAVVGERHLFGLEQAWASARGLEPRSLPLLERGIYRWIRHPLYTGTLIALWAAPDLGSGRLLLAAVLTLYLGVGYRLEERDLEREHGASYRAYRERVPAFLPLRLLRPSRPKLG